MKSKRASKYRAKEDQSPIQLLPKTDKQAQYIKALQSSPQIIVTGSAGTGKTYIASVHAAKLFKERQGIMSSVKLIWVTPDAEQLVSDMARVSNPKNQGLPPGKLLTYCVKHAHWSIFEMVDACFEINTTRDITRQILRHRSFSFQEFSQRYASVDELPEVPLREARLQDHVNRQNSIKTDDYTLRLDWEDKQIAALEAAKEAYQWALDKGIAKEVARAVLPEGLTATRMYMKGNLRSWMHFCQLRGGNGTQKECMEIAHLISAEMENLFPHCWSALMEAK